MKNICIMFVLCLTFSLLAGCSKKESNFAPSCESYFNIMNCVIEKAPEETRAQLLDGIKQAKDSRKELDQETMENVCKQSLEVGAQGFSALGCIK